MFKLEHFFPESKAEIVAFLFQNPSKHGISAKEDSHFALPLLLDLGEDLVPVWPPRVGSGLEPRHQVPLLLLEVQIHGELEEHRLHVRLLKRCKI